jgi:hypothetical protein
MAAFGPPLGYPAAPSKRRPIFVQPLGSTSRNLHTCIAVYKREYDFAPSKSTIFVESYDTLFLFSASKSVGIGQTVTVSLEADRREVKFSYFPRGIVRYLQIDREEDLLYLKQEGVRIDSEKASEIILRPFLFDNQRVDETRPLHAVHGA